MTMSIKSKINLSFLALGIIAALAVAVFNYFEIKDKVIDDAYKKAELINSFAMASRTYTVKTMRPLALRVAGADQFHPEIMGGFFVARAIADTFAKDPTRLQLQAGHHRPGQPTKCRQYR